MKTYIAPNQHKIRRKALDTLMVYDLDTSALMGQIVDLSGKGMKLSGELELSANQIYYCRIPLEKKINGHSEVFVDAQCRWCKKNSQTGSYDSGYLLRFPTPKDAEIIRKITRAWMRGQSESLNARHKARENSEGGLLQRLFANISGRQREEE